MTDSDLFHEEETRGCEWCGGEGEITVKLRRRPWREMQECQICSGTGQVTEVFDTEARLDRLESLVHALISAHCKES